MARQTKAQRLQAAFEAGRTGQNRDGSAIDPCYPDYLATHAERVAFWRGDAKAAAQYEAERDDKEWVRSAPLGGSRWLVFGQ